MGSFKGIAGLLLTVVALTGGIVRGADDPPSHRELWQVHPQFERFRPRVIAVLPMDNFSLEPDVEKSLEEALYSRLAGLGYIRIRAQKVAEVMARLGIQTPGQLQGIRLHRLGRLLKCDAVFKGRIDQSASIHAGVYDAVVVSCSLMLQDCATGQVLWQTEQWRTAHRQWQIDPFNFLLNFYTHESASRPERVAFLVEQMLKTLPHGPVRVVRENLLKQAEAINATE